MIVLGIESSCDETGLAVYDSEAGLRAHVLHSQVAVHAEYGGVVPELASRDHIRFLLPLAENVIEQAGIGLQQIREYYRSHKKRMDTFIIKNELKDLYK